MKIAVAIMSRGRPLSLIGVVQALHALSSGQNDVAYRVGCDDDDPMTIGACHWMRQAGLPVARRVGPRPLGLGGAAAKLLDDEPDADAGTILADDMYPLTPHWDAVIAQAAGRDPAGVWWWLGEATAYCIVGRRWLAAAERLYPDYFPFWFDDTWLAEVRTMATGRAPETLPIALAGRRGPTQRCRDLEFWFRFFANRLPERIAEAKTIAGKLGLPDVADRVAEAYAARLTRMLPHIARFTARFGDPRPPSVEYLACHARAVRLMEADRAA